MIGKQALRSSIGAVLLLSTAAAAYPWSAWLNASLMNGKVFGYYYYHVKYDILYSFGPANAHPQTGTDPSAGLISDGKQLLGTTSQNGLAFALRPSATPDAWTELPLARLPGGSVAPLTQISPTQFAGTEAGDVFVLFYNQEFVSKTIVYKFAPGTGPSSGITIGPGGTLYGTASNGLYGNGFVYQLTPQQGGTYSESTLYAFKGGLGGASPQGDLTFGPGGLLYGTTTAGGNAACTYVQGLSGCGVIYSLTTTGTEQVLHRFASLSEGAGPGGLTVDAAGDIVGATFSGGKYGFGSIFRLVPATHNKLVWSQIYSFKNTTDGLFPNPKLAVDSLGAIYGTAQFGAGGQGTLFVLVPPLQSGPSWTLTTLHSFAGAGKADGANPSGGLLIDREGAIYGVTASGGAHNTGTVYRLTP